MSIRKFSNATLKTKGISREKFNLYTSPNYIAKMRADGIIINEKFARRLDPNTSRDDISTIYKFLTESYDKLIDHFIKLQKYKHIDKNIDKNIYNKLEKLKKIYHLY